MEALESTWKSLSLRKSRKIEQI